MARRRTGRARQVNVVVNDSTWARFAELAKRLRVSQGALVEELAQLAIKSMAVVLREGGDVAER